MSVLIRGMQMPKNCMECPFLYDGNACYAMNKPNSMFLPLVCNGSTKEYQINKFPFEEMRVDWCPLVEVEMQKYNAYQDEMGGVEAQAMMEGCENPFY